MDDDLGGSAPDMGAMLDDLSSGLGFDTEDAGDANDALIDSVGSPAGDAADPPGGVQEAKSGEPKPAEPVGGVPAAPKPAVPGDPAQSPAGTPPAAVAGTAPKTWRPEAIAKWETLDPVVKAEIAKREEDMFAGLETYKQDASWGKALKTVLDPYAAIMQQHNIDPIVQVKGLMNAHYLLSTGSAQARADMMSKLLTDYKVDPTLVRIGDEPAAGGSTDPAVVALRAELDELKSGQQRITAERETAIRADLNGKIEKFFADPKNIYINDVANDVAALIEKGTATDLEDAYQKAIWLNPTTRAKELARQAAETEATRAADIAKKAEEARKASGANVRTRARSGSAAAATGTMDDTMAATLREIRSR